MTPPRRDEPEFSAFGPGYGECLLVHLGEGEWMIVDSCVEADHLPVLEYLRAMDVDIATAVKLVVATHWHDDHVRGIAEILALCPSAVFSCSAALSRDELLQTIGALAPGRGRFGSGVREMRSVLEVLANGEDRPPAAWAGQDRLLYGRSRGVACEVAVLAPSDQVLGDAYRSVAHLVNEGATGRVPKPDRNLGAVVLWVEVGDATMLLGSDLQEEPHRGWTTILGRRQGFDRQCEIFKVPHHGSDNAHHEPLWTKILVPRPEAVVCPHWNGSNIIPKETDLMRLCELANVHLTACRGPDTVIRKSRPMRPVLHDFGRVTLRRGSDETDWSASYGGDAGEACARLTSTVPTGGDST